MTEQEAQKLLLGIQKNKRRVLYLLLLVCACVGTLWFFYKPSFPAHKKSKNPYFVTIPIVNWDNTHFPSPCVSIQIEEQVICSSLDLGFRGFFSIEGQILGKIKEKTEVGKVKRYGFRGTEYEKAIFEIPKIQMGPISFSRIQVQREAEAFHKNSSLHIDPNELAPIDLARIGWEACRLSGNLFLDLRNNMIAFCDSADTLQAKGYALDSFAKSELLSDRGFLEVMVHTDLGSVRCVLDTGSTYNCLHTELGENQSIDDMIGNIHEVGQFQVGNKDLGPQAFHEIPIQLPIPVAAILGMEFFFNHVIFINFTEHLLYIQRYPSLTLATGLAH